MPFEDELEAVAKELDVECHGAFLPGCKRRVDARCASLQQASCPGPHFMLEAGISGRFIDARVLPNVFATVRERVRARQSRTPSFFISR
jgi:hypothetical protein